MNKSTYKRFSNTPIHIMNSKKSNENIINENIMMNYEKNKENKMKKKQKDKNRSDIYLTKNEKQMLLSKNSKRNKLKKNNSKMLKLKMLNKNTFHKPIRFEDELFESYQLRVQFFNLNQPMSQKDFIITNSLSACFSNMILLNVRYNENVENEIKKRLLKKNNIHTLSDKIKTIFSIS